MSDSGPVPARDDAYSDPDVQQAIDDFDARMDSFQVTFERPSVLEFLGLVRKNIHREAENNNNRQAELPARPRRGVDEQAMRSKRKNTHHV